MIPGGNTDGMKLPSLGKPDSLGTIARGLVLIVVASIPAAHIMGFTNAESFWKFEWNWAWNHEIRRGLEWLWHSLWAQV